ncbi:MAG: hypothetical protein OYG31_01940 [Candidatus Kaiserbacteria bacterium]|nr:hypothetical protein [Candidatus Kaiserbacteria bacterium]
MPDFASYLIFLIVGSVTIFALRKQRFSFGAEPEKLWPYLVTGWCIGITIWFVWDWLFLTN